MTTHKKKKVTRYRGSKTHGGGAMKKRRGAGNRGGRGNAGSGKRADCKKPSNWANKKYFGKFGFRPNSLKIFIAPVNLKWLDLNIEKLVKQGKASEKAGKYEIDLKSIGYNKLLGSGNTKKKMIIKTMFASAGAVEKVKKSGGDVVLPQNLNKQAEGKEDNVVTEDNTDKSS